MRRDGEGIGGHTMHLILTKKGLLKSHQNKDDENGTPKVKELTGDFHDLLNVDINY